MRLLEKICKELGVKVGEEWLGSNGYYYTITEESDIKVRDPEDKEPSGESLIYWDDILTDKVKPVWKPEKGEKYYYPYIYIKEGDRYNFKYWQDWDIDIWYLKHNLVFKTKEEAIECTNKILETTKGW